MRSIRKYDLSAATFTHRFSHFSISTSCIFAYCNPRLFPVSTVSLCFMLPCSPFPAPFLSLFFLLLYSLLPASFALSCLYCLPLISTSLHHLPSPFPFSLTLSCIRFLLSPIATSCVYPVSSFPSLPFSSCFLHASDSRLTPVSVVVPPSSRFFTINFISFPVSDVEL